MIDDAELIRLLKADESDTLERKESLSDEDKIQRAMIAFANDIAGRGGGKIIVGQKDDKTVIGLKISGDDAQKRISDIALNKCHPSIPVVIEIREHDGKSVAIVEIKASPARPHFRGHCFVRQGSTNKAATDAEITALRSAGGNPKVRQLLAWLQDGAISVTCEQLPVGYWGTVVVQLVEVTETYIVLRYTHNFSLTVAIEDLRVGFDPQHSRPKISFLRNR